jgi:hypothetical protein
VEHGCAPLWAGQGGRLAEAMDLVSSGERQQESKQHERRQNRRRHLQ